MTEKKVHDCDEDENSYNVNNLYSEQELKKITQDYLSDKIRSIEYNENVKYSNIRILLSFIILLIGLYSTTLVPFDQKSTILIYLLIYFFSFTFILFIFEYVYMKNSFIILKGENNKDIIFICNLNKDENYINLISKYDKNEESVKLELENLFDMNGYLIKQYADKKLKELLSICESKFKLKKKTN